MRGLSIASVMALGAALYGVVYAYVAKKTVRQRVPSSDDEGTEN